MKNRLSVLTMCVSILFICVQDSVAQKKEEIYCKKGRSSYKQGKYDLTIAYCDSAIAINSLYAEAYVNRGMAYADQGKYELAIADYTYVITKINIQSTKEQAISKFASALTYNPQRENAYYNRGVAYFAIHNFDSAVDDFTYVITNLNPKNASAYDDRGMAYYRLGKEDLCIADWKKAADLGINEARKNLKDIFNIVY